MNIRFRCSVCDHPGRVDPPTTTEWACPSCEHVARSTADASPALPACGMCGNRELYRKKDFPHGLGMAILLAACVASTITYGLYHKAVTWAILLGSAAFDGLLYLWVGDVVACYRCGALHRGVTIDPQRHRPFELTIEERYRQERLRHAEVRDQ